jgi:DDE superfamily endonuclease
VAEVRAELAPGTPVEVWFQDEMRVGQKNKLTYRWAKKGSRPRAIHDQRTQSTYLFGAVCPEHGTGAGLVLPACNGEAMQLSQPKSRPARMPCCYSIRPAGMAPQSRTAGSRCCLGG